MAPMGPTPFLGALDCYGDQQPNEEPVAESVLFGFAPMPQMRT